MAHDCSDCDEPQCACRNFTGAKQQERHVTFRDVADKRHTRTPPVLRDTKDIVEAGILRTGLGDIDAGAEHCKLRKRYGPHQKAGQNLQSQNHFTL